MIKNIIIVILVILLVIIIASYYYLTNKKNSYQNDRMNYINKKEAELNGLEKSINSFVSCSEQNEKYKYSLAQIKDIVSSLDTDDVMSVKDSEMSSEDIAKLQGRQIKIIGKEGESEGTLTNYHDDYLEQKNKKVSPSDKETSVEIDDENDSEENNVLDDETDNIPDNEEDSEEDDYDEEIDEENEEKLESDNNLVITNKLKEPNSGDLNTEDEDEDDDDESEDDDDESEDGTESNDDDDDESDSESESESEPELNNKTKKEETKIETKSKVAKVETKPKVIKKESSNMESKKDEYIKRLESEIQSNSEKLGMVMETVSKNKKLEMENKENLAEHIKKVRALRNKENEITDRIKSKMKKYKQNSKTMNKKQVKGCKNRSTNLVTRQVDNNLSNVYKKYNGCMRKV